MIIDIVNTAEVNPADIDTPVSLLLKCYLDIPMTSADVFARLELDQVDQDLASRKN